jgi:hypothetical protein
LVVFEVGIEMGVCVGNQKRFQGASLSKSTVNKNMRNFIHACMYWYHHYKRTFRQTLDNLTIESVPIYHQPSSRNPDQDKRQNNHTIASLSTAEYLLQYADNILYKLPIIYFP